MKKLICFFALIIPVIANAQTKEAKVAFTGQKGNYIYNLFQPASPAHPDGDVVGFRLDRKSPNDINWKIISSFSSPANYAELQENVEEGIQEAFEYRADNAYNINEVWPIYKKTFRYDSLALYLTQQHLAIAFKILLVDTIANPQLTYQYRVVQIKRDGSENGKYVSKLIGKRLSPLIVNRPKSNDRNTGGGIYRMQFTAKNSVEIPQALVIKRMGEGDANFKLVKLVYSIEQTADSIIYNVIDEDVREDALYKYTITPVNLFGGDDGPISDTLAINAVSQKMLIPKTFVAIADSLKKEVKLSWGFLKPELISNVKVYRSEDYEGGYAYLGATATGTYADKTIIPGKKYYYYLMISDKLGRGSERSTKVFALMQDKEKPNVPLYVTVDKKGNGNVINWQDLGMENRGYKIFKTNQIQGELVAIDTLISANNKTEGIYSFKDVSPTNGKITGYAVAAESLSNVLSNYSKIVYVNGEAKSMILTPPMLLDLQKDKNAIRIFWKPITGSEEIIGFNIYRKLGNGEFQKINKTLVAMAKTIYKDTTKLEGDNSSYKITAVSLTGNESQFSNELQADFMNVVYPPTSLKSFFTNDKKGINLQWQLSQSEVSGYEIYRYTRGIEPVKVSVVNDKISAFTDSGYNRKMTNYYFIKSLGINGQTSVSSSETYKSPIEK